MKLRPGGWAWIGLTGYVAAVDIALLRAKGKKGHPFCSMSECFSDSVRHPVKRWPVISAWAILTLHLFGPALPGSKKLERVDPIGCLAKLVYKEDGND